MINNNRKEILSFANCAINENIEEEKDDKHKYK